MPFFLFWIWLTCNILVKNVKPCLCSFSFDDGLTPSQHFFSHVWTEPLLCMGGSRGGTGSPDRTPPPPPTPPGIARINFCHVEIFRPLLGIWNPTEKIFWICACSDPWVINQCFTKEHNDATMGIKPQDSRSQVRRSNHSATRLP